MYKTTKIIIVLFLTIFVAKNIFATTNYVSKSGAHISPFSSLANAATNIQAAVDVASSGDTVFVNDGTYSPASEITITNDITVKSINGAPKTIINGRGTNRCFFTGYVNHIIDGFTVSNGFDSFSGGGIYAEKGIVQNCIIVDNLCAYQGGGIYCFETVIKSCTVTKNTAAGSSGSGGGVSCDSGIITNCIITDNYALSDGGGVSCSDGLVVDCIVNGNSVSEDVGGGIDAIQSTIKNCTVIGNLTAVDGGGIAFSRSTVENCLVSKNSATNSDSFGGGIYGFRGFVRNCLITENFSQYNGGGLHIDSCNADSCTIVSNSAIYRGGGVFCRKGMIENSILWNNTNNCYFYSSVTNRYNCIQNWTNIVNGIITNNPNFADADAGNFKLSVLSPCINSGTNMDWMAGATDLAGNQRIYDGTVDMGCYEFVPEPCSFIIYNLLIVIYYRGRKSTLITK